MKCIENILSLRKNEISNSELWDDAIVAGMKEIASCDSSYLLIKCLFLDKDDILPLEIKMSIYYKLLSHFPNDPYLMKDVAWYLQLNDSSKDELSNELLRKADLIIEKDNSKE